MDRRSLWLLLVLLILACAGLFLLLRRDERALPVAALAESGPEPVALAGSEALQAEPRSERFGGGRIGAPHTPARKPVGAAESRVAGYLRAQGDTPWRDAAVVLCSFPDGGTPARLSESRCEPDGGFVVSCTAEGRALLVVLARGFAPLARPVALAHGTEHLFEDLALERGFALSGSVRSNGAPLGRVEVVAIDERELPRVRCGGGELLWNGAGFDWRLATGESGEDGRYTIGGLRAGQYSARVSACRGPQGSLCGSDRPTRSVPAPQQGVDFEFESSALELHFSSGGAPLAGVDVELSSGGWSSGKRSDAQGIAVFQLVPRLDCTLLARKPGYADLRLPVSAPPSGGSASESFEMSAKEQAPEVHFLVHSESDETPGELRVRLYAPNEATPCFDQQLRSLPADAGAAEREFVVRGLKPGLYNAVLLPGQPWNDELEASSYIGTHCAITLSLTVPADGELRTHVTTSRRPALRLQFPDETGRLLPARCTLRDEMGFEIPFVLVDPAEGAPLPGRDLSTLGPTLLYSTRCLGHAKLLVEYGDRTLADGRCVFVSGQVTPFAAAR